MLICFGTEPRGDTDEPPEFRHIFPKPLNHLPRMEQEMFEVPCGRILNDAWPIDARDAGNSLSRLACVLELLGFVDAIFNCHMP